MKNGKLRSALIAAFGTIAAFAAMAFVGYLEVGKNDKDKNKQ